MEEQVKVRVLRTTRASGVQIKKGDVVEISKNDARLLVACGKVEYEPEKAAPAQKKSEAGKPAPKKAAAGKNGK